jgi:hypothetical protein
MPQCSLLTDNKFLVVRVVMYATTSAQKRCSVCLYPVLFCREFMFYKCYLYLFTYTGVNTISMSDDVRVA